jgi:hypothetical protein
MNSALARNTKKTKGLILSLMILASLSLAQVMAQNPPLGYDPSYAPNSYFVMMEVATRFSFLVPNDGRSIAGGHQRLWGPTTAESCAQYLRAHCQSGDGKYWYC